MPDSKVPAYNKIDGWANTFLKIGAGAFIGTLWEVRDTTAQLFANTFYAELLENRSTFGVALKRARAFIKEKAPGDPTWLAYAFYGDTEARFGVNP
jgi:CHAT domain-containing protein